MKQVTGIPKGNAPAPFWPNLFLYFYEEEYMPSLISSDKNQGKTFPFYKALHQWIINDGEKFERSICELYLKELELKVEHWLYHTTFLNLNITVKEGTFIYRLFDKGDSFPFSFIRMPHIESNIPQNVFFSNQRWVFKSCLFNSVPQGLHT